MLNGLLDDNTTRPHGTPRHLDVFGYAIGIEHASRELRKRRHELHMIYHHVRACIEEARVALPADNEDR